MSLHHKAVCDSSCWETLLSGVFLKFLDWLRITFGSKTPQFGLPVGAIASNHNKIPTVYKVYCMEAKEISLAFEWANSWSFLLKQHLTFVQNCWKKKKQSVTISNIKKKKSKSKSKHLHSTDTLQNKEVGNASMYPRHKFINGAMLSFFCSI